MVVAFGVEGLAGWLGAAKPICLVDACLSLFKLCEKGRTKGRMRAVQGQGIYRLRLGLGLGA
jgi:hypothetical protein